MFSQITTCCRTLASVLRVLRDNFWIMLRLTCCIVTGVVVILSGTYTILKTRSSDSVYNTTCGTQYEQTVNNIYYFSNNSRQYLLFTNSKQYLLFLNLCLMYLAHL